MAERSYATKPGSPTHPPLSELSLEQLEQRLSDIDRQLDQLAHFSLRSGAGSIGYRSDTHDSAEQQEWIQIDLGKNTPIDQIVLVPSLWRNSKSGITADGFPAAFKVITGSAMDNAGTIVASFDHKDNFLPRIAPLTIDCNTTASWVRVEASELTARKFDQRYNLELAEILVFNKDENVALHRQVSISPEGSNEDGARRRQFLVDGFTPFFMDSGQGEQSRPFIAGGFITQTNTITLDLEAVFAINHIQLHAVELNDSIPQAAPAGFALPRHLKIEGASKADFSDAKILAAYKKESNYVVGPIVGIPFPETACRYLKFSAMAPYIFASYNTNETRMGFAEIEVFSHGQNVALHKPAKNMLTIFFTDRKLEALTDGHNLYGRILSIRIWMEQLALRHELEKLRPLVATELNLRYARQKVTLRRLGWLAALLTVGICFTILIDRMLRMRQATRLKERFAADLHDELGANLHTIGLLSDLSKQAVATPEKLPPLLNRIREFTERSGKAARHCGDLLEADGLYEDIILEMKHCAERMLNDVSYKLNFSGEEWIKQLPAQKRVDLFLFYKECFSNVLRHAQASEVVVSLSGGPSSIVLSISDNGQGLDINSDTVPPSIKRRARLLRAHVTSEHPQDGGTRIILILKNNTWRFFR